MNSIVLTINNKQDLIPRVIDGIFKAVRDFELIAIVDGCTDDSENVLFRSLGQQNNKNLRGFNVIETPDVFETKANNIGCRAAKGDHIIIVQDDCVITEFGWDASLLKPFRAFKDVFAVSGNCAHSWRYNENSVGRDANGWSDLLQHHSHANKTNTDYGVFAIRDSVNRGPLAINRLDLVKLDYFDEIYAPAGNDDHDLMYRAKKELNKICGFYSIGFESKPEWGGTRDEQGKTKQWMLDSDSKNAKILYERHKDIMHNHTVENRSLC